MQAKHPIVFLLEDCPVTGLLVERVVMNEMPEVRLLWARSLAEARARAEGLQIDLFMVDIFLPDGNGFDFLWEMSVVHPTAHAIVMTATPLPEHAMHTTALGVLHFMEKPLRLPALMGHMRDALGAASGQGADADFRATLQNVTPADVLQLKCLSRATTIVEFHSEGQVGRIRFEDGEITDATAGEWRGVDGLFEIIGWKRGQMSEQPCVGFFERTIHGPWQSLLMDAAQRADERIARS